MATWDELVNYIQQTYSVIDYKSGILTLAFKVHEERTQGVLLHREEPRDGEEWAVIESAIGEISRIDVVEAVRVAGMLVCGGLAESGKGMLVLRHAMPIENLDANELERPLHHIAASADELERVLTGADEY